MKLGYLDARSLLWGLAVAGTIAFSGVSRAAPTVTPGFDPLTPEANIPAVTDNSQWYVAVRVSAAPPDRNAGDVSSVLTRRQAQNAWDVAKRALGVDNGEEKYSFVLSISAAGVNLPDITALQLDHVEDGGWFSPQVETLTVNTAQQVYSAWVPIDKSSKISIKVKHVGSSVPNFDLLTQAKGLGATLGTATGLAVTPAVQAILSQMASAVSNLVNGSQVRMDTTLSLDTFPLNGVPGGYSTTMRDTKGSPVAKIMFDFVFRRSLRLGPEKLASAGYPHIGNLAMDDNAFQMLDPSVSIQTVSKNLAVQTLLVSSLRTPGTGASGVNSFTTACGTLLSFLSAAGLNENDRVYYAVKYLAPTVNSRPDILAVFWGSCLAGEQGVADAIGVGGDIHAAMSMTPTIAANVGSYVVRKGKDSADADSADDAQIQQAFGVAITWKGEADALGQKNAMQKLAGLSAAGYHCITRKPIADPSIDRAGFTMFLRTGSEPDKVLELSQALGADESAPIAYIDYRSPTPAEFQYCARYEASRRPPGTPPTGGAN